MFASKCEIFLRICISKTHLEFLDFQPFFLYTDIFLLKTESIPGHPNNSSDSNRVQQTTNQDRLSWPGIESPYSHCKAQTRPGPDPDFIRVCVLLEPRLLHISIDSRRTAGKLSRYRTPRLPLPLHMHDSKQVHVDKGIVHEWRHSHNVWKFLWPFPISVTFFIVKTSAVTKPLTPSSYQMCDAKDDAKSYVPKCYGPKVGRISCKKRDFIQSYLKKPFYRHKIGPKSHLSCTTPPHPLFYVNPKMPKQYFCPQTPKTFKNTIDKQEIIPFNVTELRPYF